MGILDNFYRFTAILRWPVVVAGLALLFKEKIGGLVDRLSEAFGPGGTHLKFNPAEKTGEQKALSKEERESVEKVKGYDAEETDKTKNIETKLGKLEVELIFERTYRVIFGSQLSILKDLSFAPQGLYQVSLDKYFQKHFNESQGKGYQQFSQLIGFLKNMSMVVSSNDAVGEVYKITPWGESFLQYLKSSNIPTDKPL